MLLSRAALDFRMAHNVEQTMREFFFFFSIHSSCEAHIMCNFFFRELNSWLSHIKFSFQTYRSTEQIERIRFALTLS